MENMLQANGDIQGVFAANDEMALGAVEAIFSPRDVTNYDTFIGKARRFVRCVTCVPLMSCV
jgi:ABC-type sugar transport system substrate-binding protein